MKVIVLTRAEVDHHGENIVVEPGERDLDQEIADLLVNAGAAELPKVAEAPAKKAPRAGVTE